MRLRRLKLLRVPLSLLALQVGAATAQPLADPMRPPQTASVARSNTPATQPMVQTIIIGPTHRYAVIDGHTVAHGERIGSARVVRITESDVTLRDANGKTTVIGLLPQVQKKTTSPNGGFSAAPQNASAQETKK